MQLSPRAGLIAFILALFTIFSAAAPVIPSHTAVSQGISTHSSGLADSDPIPSIIQRNEQRPAAGIRMYRRDPELEEPVLVRRHVAAKVKAAFHKLGQGIKHVAQKVGHFIKTTGAKVVKFGLKIASTAEKVASKFVGFIPGVGKPIAKAMEAHSAVLNAVSDKIHVKLPGKLQKGVNALNKVRKVSGYVPREVVDIVERDGFELGERGFFEDDILYARGRTNWEEEIN